MWRERLRRRTNTKSGIFLRVAKLSFLGAIALSLVFVVLVPIVALTLPSPDKIVRSEGFSTKILDRNGKVLYDIYENERRTAISLSEIPNYVKEATIAIEDKNFYTHQGFDPFGMLRGLSRIFTKGYAQGGSTLTQQLVKNVLLTQERSILRKIREFVLALEIERRFSKDEILTMYLNEIPYGGTAFGIEAASEVYFGKKASELTLTESAILAGFPQRPSLYSPYSSDPEAYIARTKEVLRRMREEGNITKDDEEASAASLPYVKFQERGASFKAPHFVFYVQKILEERYGTNALEQGGLKVTTTLDLSLQEKAQEIVAEEISKVKGQKITNGAAVVLNPETGEILAMVGSRDFNDPDYDGQVNVAMSPRQPGSAMKPFTYVTALKKGYTASTLLMDVPTKFPGGANQPDYEPVNYDGKFRGPIQFRYALANSINVAAVKMLAMVGIKDVLTVAYDMGIATLPPTEDTLKRVGLSLTLGGGEVRLLELSSAYAPFMNKGYKVEPSSILKVEDRKGNALEESTPEKKGRVISEGEAYLIYDILSDNKARSEVFGTNSLLNIAGYKIAVKTGTTNDRRDNWTVGGNRVVLVGVWVGNNDNSPMLSVTSGVSGASPIWRRIILEAIKDKPNPEVSPSSEIKTVAVDAVSGYASHDGFVSRNEIFIKGREPLEDSVHVKLKVCKTDGKLATPADILGGNYEEKEFFVFKEEDPTAGLSGQNRWQEGILSWLSSQSDSRYQPPFDYCGTGNPVSVDFISPRDQDSNLSSPVTVKIKADSTSDISEVSLFVDGSKVRSFTAPAYEQTLDFSTGTHTIRATARDSKGNESERIIKIGVGVSWDYSPTLAPTASP